MIGRTISHYRIVEKIGSGGMGEVYAAEDLKLHRRVALKILPHHLAEDAARRERFEREATAVASLNHPNIVTVHSVEEAEGIHFITMELIAGKPLTAIIPKGGLSLARFFELAIPLSDAVAAAHRAGIIHRDLKPDNVVVGSDGRLKILDFGLAKLRDTPVAVSEASAMPTRHLTEEGQILGTVAYMSPEQVEGKPLDHRTDIFSLGVVLYEMATGKRPFQGDTKVSIISSILRDAPASATQLNPVLPRHLGRIIRQCLAKDPEERTQNAQDVRNQIADLRKEIDSGALDAGEVAAATARPRSRKLRLVTAAVALASLGVLALVLSRSGKNLEKGRRGASMIGTQIQLTDFAGQEITPSISPDGKLIAYASRAAGNWDIYVQRVGGSNPANLTKDSPDGDIEPAFSPDGERIAFRSGRDKGGIFVMGATGESVVRVTNKGFRPAWSPDGARIAYQTSDFDQPVARPNLSQLWVVDVKSGQTRRVANEDAVQPSWSPSGKRIAYWALSTGGGQRDLYTIPAEGGTPVPVTQDPALDWNPAWSPDGKALYFSSNRGGSMNLWRIPLDEATGKTQGPPEPVTFGSASEIHSASIARDGRRIVYVASVGFTGIRKAILDLSHDKIALDPAPVIRGSSPIVWPALSPDGKLLAYTTIAAGDKPGMLREDIVISSTDGSSRRRIAASDSRNRISRWSPAGDRLAFASDRSGFYRIYVVRPDGSDLQVLYEDHTNTIYPAWSPSGDRILFTDFEGRFHNFIGAFPPKGKPEEIPLPPDPETQFIPRDWSPDGTMIAGHLQRVSSGPAGPVIFRLKTRDYVHLTDRGQFPLWFPDNRRLLFSSEDKKGLSVLDIESRQIRTYPLTLHGDVDPFGVALARDGRTIYFTEREQEADLWQLDLQ
jgi:Tol biopolymer transport system component